MPIYVEVERRVCREEWSPSNKDVIDTAVPVQIYIYEMYWNCSASDVSMSVHSSADSLSFLRFRK